jgi:hypothetical protein
MGYTIIIGEAMIDVYEDSTSLDITAETVELADAPDFPNDVNPRKNVRWPGYCTWHDFCEEVGLFDLFYDDEEGLIRPHPGVRRLTQDHADAIAQALARYPRSKPPGFLGIDAFHELSARAPKLSDASEAFFAAHSPYDSTLARLLWLDWWVRWALAECTIPVFVNH